MAKPLIPEEVKNEVIKIVDQFNRKTFGKQIGELAYIPVFKGKHLFLNRKEYSNIGEIARLTYTGDIRNWEFAIFKYSIDQYDPDEDCFPGVQFVDGTVEGAMKAGMKAYPV